MANGIEYGVRRFGHVNWLGVWTLIRRENMRYLAIWQQTIFAPLITAGLFLLVFSIAIGPERSDVMGFRYITFLGLTAHQDELMSISSSLGVYHEVVESQKLALEDHSNHDHGDHYDIDHTSSYLLFNPELKLTALLTSPHEPIAMAKAIDIIIENLR